MPHLMLRIMALQQLADQLLSGEHKVRLVKILGTCVTVLSAILV